MLEYGNDIEQGAPAIRVVAAARDGTVEIDTSVLKFTLQPGEKWLANVSLNNKPVLRDPAQPLAFADFVRVSSTYPTNTTHPAGEADPGPLKIDSVVLEESGPLRAVVRMQGMTLAKEPERIILRVEAYAGMSTAACVPQHRRFLHKDPRVVFLRSMGLRLPLALDPATTRVSFSRQGRTRPKDAPKYPPCASGFSKAVI